MTILADRKIFTAVAVLFAAATWFNLSQINGTESATAPRFSTDSVITASR